jgi:hypothetical protein
VNERNLLREAVFSVFFGSKEDREQGSPLPFSELPDAAVEMMPAGLRADYEAELAAAQDPRSGRRLAV